MNLPDTLACGLLRSLVKHELLPAAEALAVQTAASHHGVSSIRQAWQTVSCDWVRAAQQVADAHNTPLLDLNAFAVEDTPRGLSEDQLNQLRALDLVPLSVRSGRLWVGLADPGDLLRLTQAAQISGMSTQAVTVALDALMQRLGVATPQLGDAPPVDTDDTVSSSTDASDADRSSVERFLRRHVLQAIERGADSLHIEPHGTDYRLRICPKQRYETLATLPRAVGDMLADALHGLPRFDLMVTSEHTVSFTLDILNTTAGRRVLMRRVVPLPEQPTLLALGFSDADSTALVALLNAPQTRLVLVTGTSAALRRAALHALAHTLNGPDEHLVVLGASPLPGLDGVTQVNTPGISSSAWPTLVDRLLDHEPTRLFIPSLSELTDLAVNSQPETDPLHLRLLQWVRSGSRQVLMGVAADHPWTVRTPVASLHIHLAAGSRQHHWQTLNGSGPNA